MSIFLKWYLESRLWWSVYQLITKYFLFSCKSLIAYLHCFEYFFVHKKYLNFNRKILRLKTNTLSRLEQNWKEVLSNGLWILFKNKLSSLYIFPIFHSAFHIASKRVFYVNYVRDKCKVNNYPKTSAFASFFHEFRGK